MDEFVTALEAVAQPVTVGGLFALAIWLGSQLTQRLIDVMAQVELARVEVTRLMAEALKQQAEAAGAQASAQAMGNVEVLRRLESADIVANRILHNQERSLDDGQRA